MEPLTRQVDATTQLLRNTKADILKVMLEQGAPRSSLAEPSQALMMAKMEVLAYELLEVVNAVRREQCGAVVAADGTGKGRESVGGRATPPSDERKRMRIADDNGDDDQLVFTAATAALSGFIDHGDRDGDSADAGAVHPAGAAATRGGTFAAAATMMGSTTTTSYPTTQTLPASFVVSLNHDLMQHIIRFAVGKAGVRTMTRLACVSRGWRDVIHSAHKCWTRICHHHLPFTLPDHEDEEEGGGDVPVVVKGLLRSAGGYRGVIMQHREALWRYDQLRRAHEAHRNSDGGGEKVGSRRLERPQVMMEPGWFRQITIIFEVFDRVRGKCILSMIGRGELANGRDEADNDEDFVLAVESPSTWAKSFRVPQMLAPWDVFMGEDFFDNDVGTNTARYFGQRARFVARVLGVRRGGGMVVLHASDPGVEFHFNYGMPSGDGEAVYRWGTKRSDVALAHQMGFPLGAYFAMFLRQDAKGRWSIDQTKDDLDPGLYFDLTGFEREGSRADTEFCTVVDFMYAALS